MTSTTQPGTTPELSADTHSEPWDVVIENTLEPFQKVVRQFIIDRPYSGIFLTMGGGKTLTTLSALTYIQPPGHILVVAPLNISRLTWPEEVRKWNIPVNAISLITNERGTKLTRAKRLKLYEETATTPPTLYYITINLLEDIVNYFGDRWPFWTVIIDESQTISDISSKRTRALFSVRPYIGRLILLTGTPSANKFDSIYAQVAVLDYGASLGDNIDVFRARWCAPDIITDKQVRRWKPANKQAEAEVYRTISHLVMSAVNTDIKLPPLHFVDHEVHMSDDEHRDYELFKKDAVLAALLDMAEENEGGEGADDTDAADSATTTPPASSQPTNPAIPAGLLQAIQQTQDTNGRAIAPVTTAELDHFDDLPVQRQENLGTLVVISAVHAATLRMKLLQYAGGAVYVDPEDSAQSQDLDASTARDVIDATNTAMTTITSRPTMIVHLHKVRKVIEILCNPALGGEPVNIDQDETGKQVYTPTPTLVAYRFISDKEILLHYLAQAGVQGVEVFDGSPDMLSRWNAGRIPVLLLQPASAGHGLNFQHGGHRLVWYNLPDNNEHYMQANARLHRIGQKNPVTIHRIITADTYDANMPAILAGKANRQQRLIDAVRRDPV